MKLISCLFMSDNKRNILIALGAGAALIGAALIYHFVSSSGGADASENYDI